MNLSAKQKRNLSITAIVILIGIFIGYYTKSVLYGLMGAGLIGWLYITSLTVIDWARMRTTAFIANIGVKGHSSIIPDDMYTVASPIKGEPNYMIMAPGGSGIVELPMHGFGSPGYFICPEEIIEEINGGVIANADWFQVRYQQIPRILQEALSWQVHFNPQTSIIFFAETSPINGTSTRSNLNLVEANLIKDETINSLTDSHDELNKFVRKKMQLDKETEGTGQQVKYVQVPVQNKE